MASLAKQHPATYATTSLILAGSVRNASDQERVESLKSLAETLGIDVSPKDLVVVPLLFSHAGQSRVSRERAV